LNHLTNLKISVILKEMKSITRQKIFRLSWIILASLIVLSMLAFLLIPLL